MKWKGIEVSDLSDADLQDAYLKTLKILGLIISEMQGRKLWNLKRSRSGTSDR